MLSTINDNTTKTSLRKLMKETCFDPCVKSESTCKHKKYMLPFDLVKSFLNKQEVVKYSGTNILDIYNGINLFLNKEENEKVNKENENEKNEENEDKKDRKYQCIECQKGDFVIDTKEGTTLCNYCGVVTRQNMNIVPEFVKETETDYRNKTKKIKGVTQKIVEMSNRYSDEYVPKNKFKEDLEHFNTFTNLPEDDLKFFEDLLRKKSSVTSVSYNGKVVGVLLASILQNNLIPEDQIKKSVMTKRKLSEIPTSPEKRFKCVNCEEKFHTMKESRFHCTLLKKYNKKF